MQLSAVGPTRIKQVIYEADKGSGKKLFRHDFEDRPPATIRGGRMSFPVVVKADAAPGDPPSGWLVNPPRPYPELSASVPVVANKWAKTPIYEVRLKRTGVASDQKEASTPEAAVRLFRETIPDDGIEHIAVAFVNTRHRIIGIQDVSRGTLDASPTYPREIAKAALAANAKAVILGHNHPSGDLTPSRDDLILTEKVGATLKSTGVNLLDHVIFTHEPGSTSHHSIRASSPTYFNPMTTGNPYRVVWPIGKLPSGSIRYTHSEVLSKAKANALAKMLRSRRASDAQVIRVGRGIHKHESVPEYHARKIREADSKMPKEIVAVLYNPLENQTSRMIGREHFHHNPILSKGGEMLTARKTRSISGVNHYVVSGTRQAAVSRKNRSTVIGAERVYPNPRHGRGRGVKIFVNPISKSGAKIWLGRAAAVAGGVGIYFLAEWGLAKIDFFAKVHPSWMPLAVAGVGVVAGIATKMIFKSTILALAVAAFPVAKGLWDAYSAHRALARALPPASTGVPVKDTLGYLDENQIASLPPGSIVADEDGRQYSVGDNQIAVGDNQIAVGNFPIAQQHLSGFPIARRAGGITRNY